MPEREGFDNLPLAPYVVEWRPDYTCNWGARRGEHSHDDARAGARDMRRRFGGQTRIVSQHVIEVHALATPQGVNRA